MGFTDDQKAALTAPLSMAHVKERSQAGRTLSYIEAWQAISEANRIFGFDAWDRETVELRQLGEPRIVNGKTRVGYSARVRITVHTDHRTIVREGCGFGSGIDQDVDQAHESALKEAESDAMKRGLMTFGNPFGLALYDKTKANVTDAPQEPPADRNGMGPSPEGPDWWGASGSGMTAHQAKKDGLDVKHEDLRSELGGLTTAAEWKAWAASSSPVIATMPKSWRVILRAEAEEVAKELGVDFNSRKAA